MMRRKAIRFRKALLCTAMIALLAAMTLTGCAAQTRPSSASAEQQTNMEMSGKLQPSDGQERQDPYGNEESPTGDITSESDSSEFSEEQEEYAEPCTHEWANGICVNCSQRCSHGSHDPETKVCDVCGETVTHKYCDGVCVRCGEAVVFCNGLLPDEYYSDCPEQGTVLTLMYHGYRHQYEEVKDAKLYVPYGYDQYDKDTRYNVVVIVHGGNCNADDMMDKLHTFNGKAVTFKKMFDWMIYNKDCEPFICVAINTDQTTVGDFERGTDDRWYGYELRSVILPYICSHYNTAAKSGEIADICEARQHIGMVGGSNGSLYTMESGILKNLDMFGNFGLISGITKSKQAVEALNLEENEDKTIYCLFTGQGDTDHLNNNTEMAFRIMLDGAPAKLQEGKNAFNNEVKAGHDWKLFTTNTYNFLLLLGQDTTVNNITQNGDIPEMG